MPDQHAIRDGYTARPAPRYFADAPQGRVYQPDVYRDLARIGARLGSRRLIDVGCGNAEKLVVHRGAFELVGIDYGPNIEACRARYDFGTWIEADLGAPGPLLEDSALLERATLVCSDVIEHVPAAERLVEKLAGALETADALLISTPERAILRGADDVGPPRNEAHVREWTIRELSAFLRRSGLQHGTIGLTRSHDQTTQQGTILAVYPRDAELLDAIEDVLIDAPLTAAPPLTLRQRVARRLAGEVRVEEAQDPAPRVLRGRLVEAEPGDAHQGVQRPGVVAAEERVAGVRILLDVVLDAGALERRLDLRRGALAAPASRAP